MRFSPGIPDGWGKIIRVQMNDHSSPDYFIDRESVGQEDLKGVSVVAEERKQIPGMAGMCTAAGIIVGQRIFERILPIARAGAAAMDVNCKNPSCRGLRSRKSRNCVIRGRRRL
jgi:hypothetical protein